MIVIAYDVANDKRLRKVAKFFEQRGIRVQKSVFELDMKKHEALKLCKEVLKYMDEGEDKLFVFNVTNKQDVLASTEFEGVFLWYM